MTARPQSADALALTMAAEAALTAVRKSLARLAAVPAAPPPSANGEAGHA